jgi:Holliday junction resolvase
MNPFLARNSRIGESGRSSEKKIAKSMGARLTPASGAMHGAKSDMVKTTAKMKLRIESKSTINASMGVKLDWLTKITKEALDTSCTPIMTITYVTGAGEPVPNGEWVMMPRWAFDELME